MKNSQKLRSVTNRKIDMEDRISGLPNKIEEMHSSVKKCRSLLKIYIFKMGLNGVTI